MFFALPRMWGEGEGLSAEQTSTVCFCAEATFQHPPRRHPLTPHAFGEGVLLFSAAQAADDVVELFEGAIGDTQLAAR
jgi:hypothetical protein